MMSAEIPRGVRRLTRYSELASYLEQFAQGVFPFIWLTGRPGVGKSEAIHEAIRDRRVMLSKSGRLSALRFFIECFEHMDEPIILDDAEHLLEDKNGRKLVSALGDTTEEKLLSWQTATHHRDLEGVPRQFPTRSSLCIIANENVRALAIQNRALMLYFDPNNEEIHRAVSRWYWEQDIHDWIGARLARFQPLDARAYIHAANDKLGCRDWRRLFMEANAIDNSECLVQDLETDAALPAIKDKVRRFGEILGSEGGSRANYFNVKKRLKKRGKLLVEPTVAVITLPRAGKRPARHIALADAGPPAPPAADLPAREAFVRPISGVKGAGQPPCSPADDSVGWERPPDDEDDDDAA